jgi:hypothetical protein
MTVMMVSELVGGKEAANTYEVLVNGDSVGLQVRCRRWDLKSLTCAHTHTHIHNAIHTNTPSGNFSDL